MAGEAASFESFAYASFESFAHARMPALLRYGLALTGDEQQAADLVQESLARTAASWPRVRRNDNPEGYVRQTMVRQNISVWRRLRREVLTALPGAAAPPAVAREDALRRVEDACELGPLLAKLPIRQRTVLVLRFYEDLPVAETAARMGCSEGRSRARRPAR